MTVGCGETRARVKVEGSQNLHFLLSPRCVFYIQVVTLFVTQPLSASWVGLEHRVRDCVHALGWYLSICVSGCLCVGLRVHIVYGGARGIAFTAHHLHFHTQFVMSVTRQGETWGSRHQNMAGATLQIGKDPVRRLGKGGRGVAKARRVRMGKKEAQGERSAVLQRATRGELLLSSFHRCRMIAMLSERVW